MWDSNKILRSSCHRKILKVLSKEKELPIMKLVQITNSSYNEVNRNLRILEEQEIILEHYLGHKRIIALNLENEKTSRLLAILKFIDA